MDIYHIWCGLKPGIRDLEFVTRAERYFEHLKAEGLIAGYRIMRKKLGLAESTLGEFHIMLELEGLAQLDEVFKRVAARVEPIEGLHHGVNALVQEPRFALYRDFPDPVRQSGQERF